GGYRQHPRPDHDPLSARRNHLDRGGADGGTRHRLHAHLYPDGGGPVLPAAGPISGADRLTMAFNLRVAGIVLALVLLALVPPVMTAIEQPFYLELFARIMIFAMAAFSLYLILGYGGMVSFGHAAYLGIGGYAVAVMSYYGIDNGFAQFAVAILGSAAVALVIGAISLRTSGVYFIMITLAFCQMLYFLGIS